MIVLDVAKKFLKELYRTKVTFVLLFLFPIFFLFIFNIAFGTTDVGSPVTYGVVVVNLDEGVSENQMVFLDDETSSIAEAGFGSHLIQVMGNLTYSNEGNQPLFDIGTMNETTALASLEEESVDVVMTISSDFSAMILNRINIVYGNQSIPGFPTSTNATISIVGNDSNGNTAVVQTIISNILEQYLKAIDAGGIPDNVEINEETVLQADSFSIFDFIAAGIFVFATILSASIFSAILLTDWDHRSIRRVKIAEINSWEYIAGYMLITFVFMQVQHLFLFAFAHLIFGFDPIGSYMNGYVILMLTSFATYALIFTASALVKDADSVGSLLGFASSILGFASNAFFSMPNVVLIPSVFEFTSGSPDFLLWDLFPWTHAVNALRGIFLFDLSLWEVGGDVAVLLILSLFWLVISLSLFSKKRLKMEDE